MTGEDVVDGLLPEMAGLYTLLASRTHLKLDFEHTSSSGARCPLVVRGAFWLPLVQELLEGYWS